MKTMWMATDAVAVAMISHTNTRQCGQYNLPPERIEQLETIVQGQVEALISNI